MVQDQPPTSRRLLVIGATGQVGSAVVGAATSSTLFTNLFGTSRTGSPALLRLDLGEPRRIGAILEETRPTHLVLAAATTNVAWCERHPDEARRVNVDGVREVARATRHAGVHLTFLSTDYVFDGAAGPYSEQEKPRPLNVYGAQKRVAEELVLEHPRSLVVRTCQVFGEDRRRLNFVLRTVDMVRRGEPTAAAMDMFGTPTFAPDLGRILVGLVADGATGVWHVAGPDHVSRLELARLALEVFGGDPSVVQPTTAAHVADGVLRPLVSGLRCERLNAIGVRATPLRDALAQLAATEVAN